MEPKLKQFQIFIKVWSITSLVLFPFLLIAFALRLPVLDQGGSMHWAIWDELGGHVGPMLFVIYITWAIFLLKALKDPRETLHRHLFEAAGYFGVRFCLR